MKNSLTLATRQAARRHAQGFSLLEVLVALLVISFGLLGIAGMQALSFSNTGVAGFRSIATLQAYSMAAAMSANENYWNQSGVPLTITVNATGSSLGAPGNVCNTTVCSAADMAAYDLQQWGATLAGVLPNGTATLTCMPAVTATSNTTCQIQVAWVEKNVAQNQIAGVAAGTPYHFEMVVTP
jgi:type IV pilus assembly protein PilV